MKGVFEVGRVDVELVCGEGADLALLEFKRRNRAAGEIVIEAAMRERRPVADGGGLKQGGFAVAGCVSGDYELLYRLCAIEEARTRFSDHSETTAAGEEDVAFIVHFRLEPDMRG